MDISAKQTARKATRSKPIRLLGRVGLIAYGLVHFLVGYLAIRIAIGESGTGEKTDKGGALQALANTPLGGVLLWAIVIGLAALVIWQIAEAVWGHHGARSAVRRNVGRVVNIGEAMVFAALAFSAAKVAVTGNSGGSGKQQGLLSKALSLPFGAYLLGAIGSGVVVMALVLAYRGIAARFTDDMDFTGANEAGRQAAIRFGQVGYVALASAYGIVGVLIVLAAFKHNPSQPVGLDPALQALASQPYGKVLLFVVAAGVACFGLYCMFDARYRRD